MNGEILASITLKQNPLFPWDLTILPEMLHLTRMRVLLLEFISEGLLPTPIHPRIRRRVRRVILHPRFPNAERYLRPRNRHKLHAQRVGEGFGRGWVGSSTPRQRQRCY